MVRTKKNPNKKKTPDSGRLSRKNEAFKKNTLNGSGNPDTPLRAVKRKRRVKQSRNALREIRKFQKTAALLIPAISFQRLVREISEEIGGGFRYQANALCALQEAAESYLVKLFEDGNLMAVHAHRITLRVSDLWMARRLKHGK